MGEPKDVCGFKTQFISRKLKPAHARFGRKGGDFRQRTMEAWEKTFWKDEQQL